jgi:hypothetical protein
MSSPPTAKQLAYLGKLAGEKGQSFAMPLTSAEASTKIKRLIALKSVGFWRDGKRRTTGKNFG